VSRPLRYYNFLQREFKIDPKGNVTLMNKYGVEIVTIKGSERLAQLFNKILESERLPQ